MSEERLVTTLTGAREAISATDPDGATKRDKALRRAVEMSIRRGYPDSRIKVSVTDGVAVLRGVLNSLHAINRVISDVTALSGIREVRSLLHLPNAPSPDAVTTTF